MRSASHRATFALLMIASFFTALVPERYTRWSQAPFQILTRANAAISVWGAGARDLVTPRPGDPTPEEARRLVEENASLKREIAAQGARVAHLEGLVDELTALRGQLDNQDNTIVIAPIAGWDSATTRATLTLARGASQGIQVDDWVTAGLPRDEADPTATGLQQIQRQWLIGRVIAVDDYQSTVRLATDPAFKCQIVTARVAANGAWELGRNAVLYGALHDAMILKSVPENLIETGYTEILASIPSVERMPLLIGRAVECRQLRTGLHYDVKVVPPENVRQLTYAFVISFGG